MVVAGCIALEKDPTQATPPKRNISNIRYAAGNRETGQACAGGEQTLGQAGEAVGQRNIGQCVAILKSADANAGDGIRNLNAGQFIALIERFTCEVGNAAGYEQICGSSTFVMGKRV